MHEAKEYHRNATECYAVATLISDPRSKAILRGIARSWLSLAEQAERNRRRAVDGELTAGMETDPV